MSYSFHNSPKSKHNVSACDSSQLPLLHNIFNRTMQCGRLCPKTKFYRRKNLPLRFHGLKDSPYQVQILDQLQTPVVEKTFNLTEIEIKEQNLNLLSKLSRKCSFGNQGDSSDNSEIKNLAKLDLSKTRYDEHLIHQEQIDMVPIEDKNVITLEKEIKDQKILRNESLEDKAHPLFKRPDSQILSNPVITCTTVRNHDELNQFKTLEDSSFIGKKVSVIEIPKEKGMKKKVTIKGDQQEECLVKIVTNNPEILNMESNEIKIGKGEDAKISLIFRPEAEQKVVEFVLFLLKNGLAWFKIVIQAKYM